MPEDQMILVVGATGELGGSITHRLLARGLPVRVLVRPGSDYGGLVEAGASPVMGDLKDPLSLARACADVRTVISTANSSMRGGDDTTESVDRRGNAALIDAARDAGVGHFVFVSALGADERSPVEFLRAKAETERRLQHSGMMYTIVQPNVFMDVWIPAMIAMPLAHGQPITLIGTGDHRHTFIAREDVAGFVVACVGQAAAENRTFVIGGPDALSWTDIVSAAGKVLGRSLDVRYVPPGSALPGAPAVVSDLANAFETYETVMDTRPLAAAFGVTPTPVSDFLKSALDPAAIDA
jgi:uncharacterized protein YbjT (DUF2867 family)